MPLLYKFTPKEGEWPVQLKEKFARSNDKQIYIQTENYFTNYLQYLMVTFY